jgi:hypothetical protein
MLEDLLCYNEGSLIWGSSQVCSPNSFSDKCLVKLDSFEGYSKKSLGNLRRDVCFLNPVFDSPQKEAILDLDVVWDVSWFLRVPF